MRTVQLARIALEAEGARLSHMVLRTAQKAILGVVAMVLLLFALTFVHVAAWYALRTDLTRPVAALVVAGADLLLALGLGLAAVRAGPGRVEREARAVRQQAVAGITSSLTVTSVTARLLRQFAAWSRPRGQREGQRGV